MGPPPPVNSQDWNPYMNQRNINVQPPPQGGYPMGGPYPQQMIPQGHQPPMQPGYNTPYPASYGNGSYSQGSNSQNGHHGHAHGAYRGPSQGFPPAYGLPPMGVAHSGPSPPPGLNHSPAYSNNGSYKYFPQNPGSSGRPPVQKIYKAMSNPNHQPSQKAHSQKLSEHSTAAFNDTMYPEPISGSGKRKKEGGKGSSGKPNSHAGTMSCYQGKSGNNLAAGKVEFLTTNNKRTKDENKLREKKLKNLVKKIIDSDNDE